MTDQATGWLHSSTVFEHDQNAEAVRQVLARLEFRVLDGQPWTFDIIGYGGGTRVLRIRVDVPDSDVAPGCGMTRRVLVDHHLPIPHRAFNSSEDVERWILDQILLVQRHEACENFFIDGERPFLPEHGAGANPYRLRRVTEGPAA